AGGHSAGQIAGRLTARPCGAPVAADLSRRRERAVLGGTVTAGGSDAVTITALQAPLAQLAEQRTLNPRVRGSSPWRRTRPDLVFYHLLRLQNDLWTPKIYATRRYS